MKAQHTITISFTIPTAKILAFLVGVVAGVALVWLSLSGIELWAPVLGLPLIALRRVQAVQEAPEAVEEHPAVVAFEAVPLPVRVALNDLVDNVLAEKWRQAA